MSQVNIQNLRDKLSEYDASIPRCKNKIEQITNYAPDYLKSEDPEWDNYSVVYHVLCCRPENHDGDCRNSRRVLGWPGFETLKNLIDEVENLREENQRLKTIIETETK